MHFTNVKKALQDHGFSVSAFPTAAEAATYLNRQIDQTSVGFGGSVTLEQLGLFESLSKHNDVLSHWHLREGMDARTEHKLALLTDVYLCSANALSETGIIIIIDGAGNRAASCLYGHEKVYFIVGRNKIVPTYEDAVDRARNVAAPKNSQRLNRKTPCAVNGDHCYDCKSKDRICCGMVVLWRCMMRNEIEVVLIDEDLGF